MPAPAFRWASVLLLVFGLSLVSSTEAFAVTRDRAPAASPVSAQWRLSCAADRNGNLRISSSKCYVNGAAASLSSCRSLARPTTAQCPSNSWSPGSWGQCSATCGGGTQTRPVTCQSSYGTTVANSLCTDTKPATAQSCNIQACPIYTWSTGAWSSCSKTCGGGTQTRAVSCKNGGTAVADSFCSASKPAPSQSCNTSTCQATDTTPPAVPTGLAASTSTCKQVDLSWKPSTDTGGSGLARYEVYRNNGYLTSVQSPFAGMADASVAPSTSYSYEVAAVDNAGNPSGRSVARTATTSACATGVGSLRLISKVAAFTGAAPNAIELDVDEARNLVYATSVYGGIKVLDVSNDAAPRVIGSISLPDGQGRLTLLGGTTAYVPQRDHLALLDLSVPSSPRVAARVPLPVSGFPSEVLVAGSRAYVSVSSQLLILDISNQAAPRSISSVPLPQLATALAASGGFVFAGSSASTDAIDVRNPAAPVKSNLSGGRGISGMTSNSGYLYQYGYGGGAGSLLVFDVSRYPTVRVALNAYYPSDSFAAFGGSALTSPPSSAEVWLLDTTQLLGRAGIPIDQTPPPAASVKIGADAYALVAGKAGSVVYALDASGALNVIALEP